MFFAIDGPGQVGAFRGKLKENQRLASPLRSGKGHN
jgi:hypothetical protein